MLICTSQAILISFTRIYCDWPTNSKTMKIIWNNQYHALSWEMNSSYLLTGNMIKQLVNLIIYIPGGGTWYAKWRVCSVRKFSTHPLIWECFFQNAHVYDQFFSKLCRKGHQKLLPTQLYGKKSPKTHPRVGTFQSKTHPYAPSIPVPKLMGVPPGYIIIN